MSESVQSRYKGTLFVAWMLETFAIIVTVVLAIGVTRYAYVQARDMLDTSDRVWTFLITLAIGLCLVVFQYLLMRVPAEFLRLGVDLLEAAEGCDNTLLRLEERGKK